MKKSWLLILFAWISCSANPISPVVIQGDATYSNPAKDTLFINTTKDQTFIHWDSFSIDVHEMTTFFQPSKDSFVLNKVVGDDLSVILGCLNSNGQIMLVNPNGILFGKSAVIDTGGFIASTLNIDFSDEGILFKGESREKIINHGTIRAWDGNVSLISHTVQNFGEIDGKTVQIGAGEEILLQKDGEQQMYIRAHTEERNEILNSGKISALQAELRADGNPYSFAVKHEGIIDALGTQHQNGRVILVAEEGINLVSGAISAPSGTVQLLGDKVGLIDKALIDVSADFEAGTILVGGSYQGRNPLISNATSTTALSEVTVKANALVDGCGGEIIFWSDGHTRVHGIIEAKGAGNGNGGFLEISGLKSFDIAGLKNNQTGVQKGTLLLDPEYPVTISTAASVGESAGPIFTPNGTSLNPIVNLTDIETALAGSNVVINSNGGGAGNPPGGITLVPGTNYNMNAAATGTFTLNNTGANGIVWNGTITFQNASNAVSLVSSSGGVTIRPTGSTPAILQSPGNISIGTAGTPIAGDIVIEGISTRAGQVLGVGAGNIDAHATGDVIIGNTTILIGGAQGIESLNGDINLSAGGNLLLQSRSSAISRIASTGTGNINIPSIGGDLTLRGSTGTTFSSLIETDTGDITISNIAGTLLISAGTFISPMITPMRIFSSSGTISISGPGNLSLVGGNGGGGSPFVDITTASATPINIDMGGSVSLLGGGSFTAASATASILNDGSGGVTINAQDVTLTAGGGTQEHAEIVASTGDVNITAENVSFDGGSGSGKAQITSGGGVNITTNNGGNLSMFGGTGALPFPDFIGAQIEATGAVNLQIAGSTTLQGGSSTSTSAQITSDMSTVTLNTDGDLNLLGGTGGTGPNVFINTLNGDPIDIDVGGNALFQGGSSTTSNITIGAQVGGPSNIDLNVSGNLTMQAGTGANSGVFMHVPSFPGGTQNITVGGSMDITAGLANSNAPVQISGGAQTTIRVNGGNLTINAPGTHFLNDASIFSTDLDILVAVDINMTGNSGFTDATYREIATCWSMPVAM